jgi:hypothetical protein
MSSLSSKAAGDLRNTWQARLLAVAKGTEQAVSLIILAQEWPNAMDALLRVVFPGFTDLKRPFLIGYARIWTNGAVLCPAMFHDGKRTVRLYDNPQQLNDAFRNLADKLKLDDGDRADLFRVLKRWVVADHRIGVNGERLAS